VKSFFTIIDNPKFSSPLLDLILFLIEVLGVSPDCQKTVIHIVVKSLWQPALWLNSYFCLKKLVKIAKNQTLVRVKMVFNYSLAILCL